MVSETSGNPTFDMVGSNTLSFCLSPPPSFVKVATLPPEINCTFVDIAYSPDVDTYVVSGTDFAFNVSGQNILLYKQGNGPWQYVLKGTDVPSTLSHLAWGNGIFVSAFRGHINTSTDGINWTTYANKFSSANVPNNPSSVTVENITFVNGYFYISLRTTTTQYYTYRSVDGVTWTLHQIYIAGERHVNWYAADNDYVIYSMGINPTSAKRYVNFVQTSIYPFLQVYGGYRSGRYVTAYKRTTDWGITVTATPVFSAANMLSMVNVTIPKIAVGEETIFIGYATTPLLSIEEGVSWINLTTYFPPSFSVGNCRFINGEYWVVGTSHTLLSIADRGP